jgi:hypothetical protein
VRNIWGIGKNYRTEANHHTKNPNLNHRSGLKKWRDNIISAFIIIIFLAFVSCLIIFDPNHPSDQNWLFALLGSQKHEESAIFWVYISQYR